MKLRDYQEEICNKWVNILKEFWVVYLAMEVRTWKTITSLAIAEKIKAKKVLFITKLKAISSIKNDLENFSFECEVINYESVHKIDKKDFDLLILDEAHKMWTFPKANAKQKLIKKNFWNLPIIFLSWTPTSESYSQYFHQFFTSNKVWNNYKNFYSWAKKFVQLWFIYTSYWKSNDYSNANYDLIMKDIWHLIISYTQKEAWFNSSIEEHILRVKMKDMTYSAIELLKKDKIIKNNEQIILADTWVKEMQKIHQMYSGTIKLESWETLIFDKSKAEFIKEYFKLKKIWIFYKFKAEGKMLKLVFNENITDDLEEFKKTDKNIMLQIVSWREWISLKEADFLVFFNIDFSALSYWQARDRLTTMERQNNTIYWVFSENWIEEKIYKTVQEKKDYTLKLYNARK